MEKSAVRRTSLKDVHDFEKFG